MITLKQVKMLKKGDKVKDKYGNIHVVKYISPYWNGLLTTKQLEERKNKPDGYSITVEHEWKHVFFDRKELCLVKEK